MDKIVESKSSVSYLKSIKDEIKKISWTSKKELISATKVVIVSTFLFGFAIYVADISIKLFLSGISKLMRFIG